MILPNSDAAVKLLAEIVLSTTNNLNMENLVFIPNKHDDPADLSSGASGLISCRVLDLLTYSVCEHRRLW